MRLLGHHMQWRGPGAVRGSNDAQLQHVFKFFAGDLEFFWGKTAGSGGDWWACGTDVVGDVVFDGSVLIVMNSGEFRKF